MGKTWCGLMRISYYPGCSLESTGRAFERSCQAVCYTLGVELAELEGWTCCGASPAAKTSRLLSIALAARNLNLARKQGAAEVVTPCPFCFRRLKSADASIRGDARLSREVGEALGESYLGEVNVNNILGLLHDRVGVEAIRARVTRPLAGLRVVAYYGCSLVRPPAITGFDHPEHPRYMDEILDALGVEVLDWNFKTECCGAGLAVSRSAVVVELCGRILEQARLAGAEAIVVACQLCQINLDVRQAAAEARFNTLYRLPVLYFTELMGLAFGLPAEALGLKQHIVDTRPLQQWIK